MTKFQHCTTTLALIATAILCPMALAEDGTGARAGQPGAAATSFQPLAAPAPPVVHCVPASAAILSVPLLTPGKPAWITVVDERRRPIAAASVFINGRSLDADNEGRLQFIVPNAGALSISLRSAPDVEVSRVDFALLPNGLLSTAEAAAVGEDVLPAGSPVAPAPGPRPAALPTLVLAPALVAPGQTVVVLGSSFDALPGSDRLFVDNVPATVVSASGSALLAQLPINLSIGPIKEIFATTSQGNTASLETDVARTEFIYDADDKGKPLHAGEARAALVGTNLPALVEVTNNSPAGFALTAANGQRLSNGAILVVPGGEPNATPLKYSLVDTAIKPSVELRMLPDVPDLVQWGRPAVAVPDSLKLAFEYATVVKLKRRLLGVEARLSEIRQKLSAPDTATAAEQEKRLAELRSLSLRQIALSTMLKARQGVFAASGGTSQQYRQAMDDAAGGAYYFLESSARAVAVVPNAPVIPPARRAADRPLVIRLPEPRFKLWPPADSLAMAAPQAVHEQGKAAVEQAKVAPEKGKEAPEHAKPAAQAKGAREQVKVAEPAKAPTLKPASGKLEVKAQTEGHGTQKSGAKHVITKAAMKNSPKNVNKKATLESSPKTTAHRHHSRHHRH
jgi:hypothetical protein